MTDEIRPPPFPLAKDADTEPGIGIDMERLALRRENMRLRQERNAARQDLTRALTESAPGSLPPPTRKQRAVKLGLTASQYAILVAVIAAAAPVLARKWPAYAELISAVVQNLGLQ